MYSLTAQEAVSLKSRCLQGWSSLGAMGEKLSPAVFQLMEVLRNSQNFLAYRRITSVSDYVHIAFSLCLFSVPPKIAVIEFRVHPN